VAAARTRRRKEPRSPAGTSDARSVIERLLRSPEPSIRWKTRVHVLGEDRDSKAIRELEEKIRTSPRVRALLSRRNELGRPGTALRFLTDLELADGRADSLVERLLRWQWPDGGWNCDRHPEADTSSFMETLLPMLGLAAHARDHPSAGLSGAIDRASEVFLRRRLFRRVTNGAIIHADFVTLHYPRYWHYDILGGLTAMARLGKIRDPRCEEALDLLEAKRLPGGGWPAESSYYLVWSTLFVATDDTE